VAAAPLKTYNLDLVFLMVGTVRVTGGAEGGVIAFEYSQDDVEMMETADGQSIANVLNSTLAYANITVKETSLANKLLGTLYAAQRTARSVGAIPPLNFQMLDTVNGDAGASQYATFISPPTMDKGKTAGDRVWRIALPQFKSKAAHGSLLFV